MTDCRSYDELYPVMGYIKIGNPCQPRFLGVPKCACYPFCSIWFFADDKGIQGFKFYPVLAY